MSVFTGSACENYELKFYLQRNYLELIVKFFSSLAIGKSNLSNDFEGLKSSDEAKVATDDNPESLPSKP